MIYRPVAPRSLWGFWIIEWEGAFHIFYLEDVNADYSLLSWQKNHDHIGHAVSKDLVHWEARPSLCVKGEPGTWNEMPSGGVKTGCMVRHEDMFYMFAGASRDGIQLIGLWTSDDLANWRPHPNNPVLKPGGPYYHREPTPARPGVSWRDPGIFFCREDGHYHMCISAMLKEQDDVHALGSTLGHVRSRDLVHWEYLPPFELPGFLDRFYQNEEAEHFEIDGRHYLILDGGTTGGMRTSTPSRDDARGSFYVMGSKLEGPYTSPDDDLLIGNDMGARCATTGRVLRRDDTNIYIHFSIAGRPALGAPKEVCARPDGTLYLGYLPMLEKLETGVICESIEALPESDSPDPGQWQRSGGALACNVRLGGSVYRVAEDISDCHLSCTLRGLTADRAGVVVRISMNEDAAVLPKGVGIVLDFDENRMFVSEAEVYPRSGWYCRPLESCRMSLSRGKEYQLRCFVRGEHLEVYLDDRWVFTTVLPEVGRMNDRYRNHYRWGPEVAASGAVELMVEHGEAVFSGFRLASIEPLA